jgi:hypothetical protein
VVDNVDDWSEEGNVDGEKDGEEDEIVDAVWKHQE